jgi:hypothetical protein
MILFLIFVHVLLCCLAIGFGSLTLLGMLKGRMVVCRMIWFLRCSLGSNTAVLFLSFDHLIPAQKVAMVSVYAAGLVILAWRAFHLTGAWRQLFAFALAIVLYLNIVALSIQLPAVCAQTWILFHVALFTAALSIGILAAMRFSARSTVKALRHRDAFGAPAVRLQQENQTRSAERKPAPI